MNETKNVRVIFAVNFVFMKYVQNSIFPYWSRMFAWFILNVFFFDFRWARDRVSTILKDWFIRH